MKKQLTILLCLSLFFNISSAAEEMPQLNRLQKLKSRLTYEYTALKQCIKRDPSCDRLRKNLYITISAIVLLLPGVLFPGWRFFKKRKKRRELVAKKVTEQQVKRTKINEDKLKREKERNQLQQEKEQLEKQTAERGKRLRESPDYNKRVDELNKLTKLYSEKSQIFDAYLHNASQEVDDKRNQAISLIKKVIALRDKGIGELQNFQEAKKYLQEAITIVESIPMPLRREESKAVPIIEEPEIEQASWTREFLKRRELEK
jgi:hypothetical protein